MEASHTSLETTANRPLPTLSIVLTVYNGTGEVNITIESSSNPEVYAIEDLQ